MKKLLCIILIFALSISLSFTISCSRKAEDSVAEPDETDKNAAEAPTEETTAGRIEIELPELNLNGRDFVIITNDYSIPIWSQRDIGAEEINGETINDAVYSRNSIIEEKFNCNIIEKKENDLVTPLKKSVQAGDHNIDVATVRFRNLFDLASNNNLIEFKNLNYNDLAQPWWDQNCVRQTSVEGKLFAVASDLTLMDNDSTSALVFNKKLQADYSVEDLYKLVLDGKWTLDKLLELSKLVSVDVDGNGIRDNHDSYGLLYQRDSMTSFLTGCNEYIAKKDENDVPYMTLNTAKTLEILNKLYDILYDEVYCFHVMKFFDPTSTGFTEGMNQMFQSDLALFMWIRMADVENLRTMDTNFGILPIPKYNETQENYCHNVNPYVGVLVAVPQCTPNIDEASIVLEALTHESKYILSPAYYDICLNTKIARDEESSKMLDIIFTNTAFDIGDLYDFGGLGTDLLNMTMKYDRNIVSAMDIKANKSEQDITKLLESYRKIGE